MKVTEYFKYIRKRPDRSIIKDEWIEYVVKHPLKEEIQADGRIRRWAKMEETDGRILRVIFIMMERLFIMHFLIDHSRRIDK